MDLQIGASKTVAISESVNLGEILDSCKYHWSDHFVTALAHTAFPEYFAANCKFWGAQYSNGDKGKYMNYHFVSGFPEQGVVASYDVTLRDKAGERIDLPAYGNIKNYFSQIKSITIDAKLKLVRNMNIGKEGIVSYYPVGGFSEHPILGDEKYFTAMEHVVTSLLPKRGLAKVETPIAKLITFEAPWEIPKKNYVAIHLGVPDPTCERVERAALDFVELHQHFMENANTLATAVLLTHTALTAKESQLAIESECGELPHAFATNIKGLYETADQYIESLQAPSLNIWNL